MFLVLCLFVVCQHTQKKRSSDIEKELKLYPVDEAHKDLSFKKFRAKLIQAIKRRDLQFLLNSLSDEIRVGFYRKGKKGFIDYWGLASKANKSQVWHELGEILRLGGSFRDNPKRFLAPYTFSNFSFENLNLPIEGTDADDYGTITGRDVNIRKKPVI